ncbi:Hsp20/alpha crystallin family protein [Butyrivibrio sp. FCS014]|uniref:Hsp20/alpha crystallin family protein n=1 Tax=Butyrivibrio sp. FCS014 TaxID=1408304 RepID=UPI0004648E8E|nr:Hsp20/alpha crystallin family protein [Butyrivibrio sp. FCS014]
MLMPMLWSNNDVFDAMDDFFNDGFWGYNAPAARKLEKSAGLMKTDVIEKEDSYQLEAELPGFNKEDISIDLKNDTLTISASHNENKDEKDENGKYIRRERRSTSYERSFHVEGLKPEDIIAQYRNGILTVHLPKKEAIPQKEEAVRIEVKD